MTINKKELHEVVDMLQKKHSVEEMLTIFKRITAELHRECITRNLSKERLAEHTAEFYIILLSFACTDVKFGKIWLEYIKIKIDNIHTLNKKNESRKTVSRKVESKSIS